MSRQTVKTKLVSLISQGLSVHLISLPSLGTSRFLRELTLPGRQVVYLDGALPNLNLPHSESLDSPTTVILDHFGYLLDTQTTGFFRQLKAVRDSHRETLNFILATNRHHQLHTRSLQLSSFFEVASESHLYFSVCSPQESAQVIKNVTKRYQIDGHFDRRLIYSQTGGIAGLVKTLVLQSNDPDSVDRLNGILTQIWISLGDTERQNLTNLIKDGTPPTTNRLLSWGLISSNHCLSQLLKDFVLNLTANNFLDSLTKTEGLIFEHLHQKKGLLVPRDELVSAGWPDSDPEGVSAQSLDQTISRLRRKLSPHFDLTSARGKGFRLTSL